MTKMNDFEGNFKYLTEGWVSVYRWMLIIHWENGPNT